VLVASRRVAIIARQVFFAGFISDASNVEQRPSRRYICAQRKRSVAPRASPPPARQRDGYSTGPTHRVPGFHHPVYRETINKIYAKRTRISWRSLEAHDGGRKGRFAKRRQKFTRYVGSKRNNIANSIRSRRTPSGL